MDTIADDALFEFCGTEFKPADQLFFDQIREEAVADTQIQQAVMVRMVSEEF